MNNDRGAEARSLIRNERHGVLSTISRKVSGWPFASVTPYALSAAGEPIILISEIAEHTKNLRADPRASLFIQDSKMIQDPQAGARITLMGRATPVPESEQGDARRRYLSRFPQSESYFQVHDFSLFRLSIEHVRFIGGFGEIYWLEPSEVLQRDTDPLARYAEGICKHMNKDHPDALILYCAAFSNLMVDAAEMIGIDMHGFDILARIGSESRRVRIEFPSIVSTSEEVRSVMVAMLKQAKDKALES